MLGELGWELPLAEVMRLFIGKSLLHETKAIGERTGREVGAAWLAQFQARRNERLAREVGPIPGAVDAVAKVHALFGGRIALCSGADRPKVELQLARCGLARY